MTTTKDQTTLNPAIRSRLARLRSLIRSYVVVQGLARTIACIALVFWVTLLIDWMFEPSTTGRAVILGLGILAVLFVLYRSLLRRLFVRLTDRSMAVLLERRHEELDDRLLTVVELGGRDAQKAGYDPRMLSHTRDEVLQLMPHATTGPVFNITPLLRSVAVATVLAFSVIAFAIWQSDAAGIWLNRSVLLGERTWPRATRILVDGFPERDGRRLVKVAKGSSLLVRAKADTMLAIPDALQIRYATQEASGRPKMTRLKKAVPGRDAYQYYEYQFKNIQSKIDFDVVALHGGIFGKNDRVEDLEIEAVDSPDLTDIKLACKFPAYLARKDEEFSVRLVQPLPEGTDVTIYAGANKDLISARYRRTLNNPDAPWQDIEVLTIPSSDAEGEVVPRGLRIALGALRSDARIEFQLHDTDEVTNQQPIRLLIRIVPDEVPRVEAHLVGIGKAVTPVADLPVRGTIWDDHSVAKTWFDYMVDDGEPATRQFVTPPSGELTEESDVVFQMADLKLEPGQKFNIGVQAADNYTLSETPHIGIGQRYELQVVSESELRGMLETRERILRRRFEGIIAEMRRARDSLTRLLDNPQTDDDAADSQAAAEPAAGADTSDTAPDVADEDVADGSEAGSSRRQAARRLLRVEAAVQTSDRMSHETRDVAEQFDLILVELQNNNVSYIEELQRRLGEGISAPLKTLADKQFPLLDDRLEQLRSVLGDDGRRGPAVLAARGQVDAILRDMEVILENMLELQQFNELLADLRKIIDAQKQVSQLTEEEREALKQRLKDELKKGLLD